MIAQNSKTQIPEIKALELKSQIKELSNILYDIKEELRYLAYAIEDINNDNYLMALSQLSSIDKIKIARLREHYGIICRDIRVTELGRIEDNQITWSDKSEWLICISNLINDIVNEINKNVREIEELEEDDY